MNRIFGINLLLAVVSVPCFAGAAAARPDDPPGKGPAELQGCWKLASIEIDGQTQDPIGGGQPRWVVKGDTCFYGGEVIIRFTADPSTSPRVIDLKFRDPERVYEGIYAVEKDVLKVCLNGRQDAKDRPGVFSTKDQPDWRLLTFEREKSDPTNSTVGATAFAGVQLRADEDAKAVVVQTPIQGSPADKAGLKKGDVILKVGPTEVTELQPTIQAVRRAKPGEKLEFRIRRDGKEMTVTVAVGVFPFDLAAGLG
jgi:uncharacterized protein (TIGR03067 family)